MYSPSENRQNAGATSKDFEQVRQTRSRTKITTKEDMLGDATVKSTQIRKLLDFVNGLQKLDLIGAKKEYDAFMNRCELGPMRESEDRYFSPITSPTQARQNDDYYKGKYKQLQKEQEQYQATEASLNTEIERLKMELERKKDDIEYMKAEKQENYKSQDTSGDAQRMKILLRENDEMKKKVKETEKTLKLREEEQMKWAEAMEKMRTDISKYKTENLQMVEEYKKRLKEEQRKTKDAEEAKMQALTRLSKEMGTKLNDNNPAIADLSDPNRATKLAEIYSEIYDNEWTDALEELDNYGYTEEESIRLLLDIVKKADEFCKKKAEDQLKNIEDSFFTSNAGEDKSSFQNKKNIMKMLKDHRKSTAEKNAERIYKEFSTRHDQKNRISAEYVKKIVKLCWLMAVQDPPVCFGNEANADDRLNTDIFKPYTQTGITVSYTVWLPMFLHEGGPLLSKGVAQPVSTRAKSAPTSRTNGYRNDKTEVKSRPTPERYTAENRIPQTKYAWESTVETKFHYNEPKHKYHQTNDYKLDRHTMHIPRNEFATSVHNYDTRSYLGTNYNTTYTSPKYEQKTVLPHRLGNYAMDPYRRY